MAAYLIVVTDMWKHSGEKFHKATIIAAGRWERGTWMAQGAQACAPWYGKS